MLRHDAPEKILVLHGPNLNLFGRREPHIYGTMTLEQINERLRTLAAKVQVQLITVQSNHEGVLVDTFHKQMYVTYEEDTIGVEMIPRIGAGNVMWASDFPHGDSTWPNSLKVIDESLGALSEEDRRKVISDNAAALYKIS